MTFTSRTYYRNDFFHIGHLKTLFDNERYAKINNGYCYAIVDDRQDPNRVNSIKEDFDYLELKRVKPISVRQEHNRIINFTIDLVEKGQIYMCQCEEKICQPDRIIKALLNPKFHYQLRLCSSASKTQTGTTTLQEDPSIGYTHIQENGTLKLVLIFDYIIKVLDELLKINTIIGQIDNDIKDPGINICNKEYSVIKLDTYQIYNFRYSKRGWSLHESNPCLLTIKGLKERAVPVKVLKAFYLHACQFKIIKIQFLSTLLTRYLSKTSEKTLGVLKPLKVMIENWPNKQTEYIYGPKNKLYTREMKHYPLSGVLYIDSSEYGLELCKINKHRSFKLSYGPTIKCTEIDTTDYKSLVLHANLEDNETETKQTSWISAPWGETPCHAKFYLYGWFYTGYNTITKPEIVEGYIDNSVFNDLNKIYQIENLGYFMYNRNLSVSNNMPTFIRISKI